MARQPDPQTQNTLLANLPSEEWASLASELRPINLMPQTTIYRSRQMFDFAYFPLSGYVSLMVSFGGDFHTEVASISSEGMVGVQIALGHVESTTAATVQLPTTALRISATALVAQIARLPTLRRILLRHAGVQAARSMQLAACNAHHVLDARLARCLLGLHDHCHGDECTLTHENLASLLCAHRPSVSVSLKRLQQRGLIQQHTRFFAITDRAGLEQVSCKCYAVMRGYECMDGRPTERADTRLSVATTSPT